ncbi:MAG TPA: hypothetical protein VFM05_06990 [Candidatus Saccharimonadales bacterium]|nr:hypothetical protein [Candidatus Saccharimonadales bacterium]
MFICHARQSGFAHLGLLLAIVFVVSAVVATGFLVFTKNKTVDNRQPYGETSWTKGCTSNDRVPMTHLPMNMKDVASFTPYGLTAGAHVTPIDHLYFYPQPGPRDKYPVYAMADGFITEITVRGINVDTGAQRPPEYRYMIQHSCQTISYYDLITKLDDSIIRQYPDAATKGMSGRFPIKAGQIVGWIGSQSLDTAIYNMDLILPGFITPKMYEAEPWKVHTDDFLSYFSKEHQAEINKLNKRKAQPLSGKIDYDQPGKLIGNWFKEGTNGYAGANGYGAGDGTGRGYWSGHLAIYYHHIQSDKIIVSLGEFKDGDPMAFAVAGNAPDPATITKNSGVVTYELIQAPRNDEVSLDTTVRGVALFQVLDGEKLKVEIFPDKKGSEVTGFVSPVTYER